MITGQFFFFFLLLQVYIRRSDTWIPSVVGYMQSFLLGLEEELESARFRLQNTIPIVGPVTWPGNERKIEILSEKCGLRLSTYCIDVDSPMRLQWHTLETFECLLF